MDNKPSFASLALAGVERIREKDHEPRGRVCALPLLLRGAYYTGEAKWRAYAEEDLRALWRGGVHDHVGGGFFSASADGEWLRPQFEKRLDDNAILALLYAEAWEKGRMAFHREAAESTLDFCLRELADPSGLYRAGQYAAPDAEENPFLFTPAQLAEILGSDDGRHFGECYDITAENNCGEGSVPNLILNRRWSLIPEGYDNLRERVRLAREARGGVLTDERSPLEANALLLAALARAARAFSDRRYLAAAEELSARLSAAETRTPLARAARLFALCELYAADFDPAHIAAARAIAASLGDAERGSDGRPSAGGDRTLSLAALGFDALCRLTGEDRWRRRCLELLRELTEHPARHGPESLAALCVPFAFGAEGRALLCVTPEEKAPAALSVLTERYAPDLTVLLKTPGNADALAAAAPGTAAFAIGGKTLFFSQNGGKWGPPSAL